MTRAICYLLKPMEVEYTPEVVFPRTGRTPIFDPNQGGSGICGYLTPVTVPIDKHVRVCKLPPFKPSLQPIHELPYEFEDHFFGVEPALEQILREPYRAELEKAKEELREMALELASAHTRGSKLDRLLLSFTNAPLWKRVWMALRGYIQ